MILGHDFHSVAGYEEARRNVSENLKSPTWLHLLRLLEEVPVPLRDCFFTNAYMGLRTGPLTTGRFPGSRDSAFVDRCRAFFILQLKLQRPRVVVALGAYVPAFLAPLSLELAAWKAGHSFGELDKQDLALVRTATFQGAEHTCSVVALPPPSLRRANVGRRRWGAAAGHQAELLLIRAALQITS